MGWGWEVGGWWAILSYAHKIVMECNVIRYVPWPTPSFPINTSLRTQNFKRITRIVENELFIVPTCDYSGLESTLSIFVRICLTLVKLKFTLTSRFNVTSHQHDYGYFRHFLDLCFRAIKGILYFIIYFFKFLWLRILNRKKDGGGKIPGGKIPGG